MAESADTPSLRARLTPVIGAHICLHMAMSGTRRSAPLFALDLSKGQAAAGWLVALVAVTQIFLSLPAGRFADRHGFRRPVRVPIVFTVVAVGLAAVWPTYGALCVTAVLCGGAVGGATIALQRHAGRVAVTPAELRETFSWVSIAPAMSNFLGPFSAGVLIDLFGFQVAFAFLAVMPLGAWVILRKVHEPPRAEAIRKRTAPAWDLLRNPGFRWVLILGWFMNASWDLHGFLVPIFSHERGLSASVIGSIIGAFAIGAAAVRLLIPVLARQIREWAVITASIAVAGLSIMAYPTAPGPMAMGALSCLLGVALGLVQPMVMAMLHQVATW